MNLPTLSCSVSTRYLPEQSDARQALYAFAYTITIRNDGPIAVQLIGRHWRISDSSGRVEEVDGLGVIGQQPLIRPGESYEYTSWAQLVTPSGRMEGRYDFVTEQSQWFQVPVPVFEMSLPQALH